MAIISNFELLYKPIAPVTGPASEVGRTVVQGYFLEISNLENRDIKLILRTRTSVRDPADSPNTEFTNTNNSVVYDITADNVFSTTMTSAGEQIVGKQLGHYVPCLFIPAGQTASVAILPNLANLFASPPADLAIRGYTELILSSNVDSFSPLTFSDPETARVLVSAEHRGTFLDSQFDPSYAGTQINLDFDQLSYSLNTANGKALQVINTHAPYNDPFQNLLTSNALITGMRSLASTTSTTSLSTLSDNLFKGANSPKRSTGFMLGTTPVRFEYSVKDGKYVVDEKSAITALNLVMKRKRLTEKELDLKTLVKNINKALSGDKRAEKYVEEMLDKLI
ncbi:hypothetical protein C8N46_105325 [Kordia periserrulae]|uniref:Uncharacterized protein n=1 Tax=Kordia periserrulae TaxID=701523 RepID=A0A2T6BYN3_9FLAO|nr:hypothetical protein [Kordia periserrulae]PTX61168.1 hypothetical protein C8N46_105325 [Kordia periserrulae]